MTILETVTARWEKTEAVTGEDVDQRKTEYAICADGVLLMCQRVHWRADRFTNPHWQDWGWSVQSYHSKPAEEIDRLLTGRGFRRVRS